MSKENMDYLSKCRLCLSVIVDKERSFPLYIRSDNNITRQIDEDVVSMISYCVSVQIDNITTFPAHLCATCYEDLQKCNNFKKKCQDSDIKLKNLVEKNSENKSLNESKGNQDADDKTIWPLLTPEVTLTEGSQPKDAGGGNNASSSNTTPSKSRKQKITEMPKKIRVKKLTELNGNCAKKSESQTVSENLKAGDVDFDEDAPLADILESIEKKESKRGKYQCSYCDETFRRQVAKQVHEKEHRVLYKCVLCYESFHTHLKLQKHRADVHNEDPYCCSFCSKSFSDVHSWTDHLKKNHVCCSKCRSFFETKADLASHTCLKKALLSKGCTPEELQNRIQYDFPRCHAKRQKFVPEKKRYSPKKNYYQLKKMRLLAAAQSTEFVTVNSSPEDKFILEDSKQRGPFPCFRCDKDFTDKGSLICHQAVAHPGQPIDNTQRPPKKSVLFCKFCLSFFRHVSDMNSHICQSTVYSIRPKFKKLSSSSTPSQFTRPVSEPDSEPTMSLPRIKEAYGFADKVRSGSSSPLLQDLIEKKPVVPKLLPASSVSKMFNDIDSKTVHSTYSPSITKIFNHIPPPPPAQVLIKEEITGDSEDDAVEDLSSSHSSVIKSEKVFVEPPESVFKVNPNLLATLGIRQDTSL